MTFLVSAGVVMLEWYQGDVLTLPQAGRLCAIIALGHRGAERRRRRRRMRSPQSLQCR